MSLLYRGWALWILGHPDRGLGSCIEAVDAAKSLGHPFSVAFAHSFMADLYLLRREYELALEHAHDARDVCAEHGFVLFDAWAEMACGRALVGVGKAETGTVMLRKGIRNYEATGAEMGKTFWLSLVADAFLAAGTPAAGLDAIRTALAFAAQTGEVAFVPELLRLEGELTAMADPANRHYAQRCFEAALAEARKRNAKSWELRTRMSLARFYDGQGPDAAAAALADVCEWFTEGLDSPDLQEARALVG